MQHRAKKFPTKKTRKPVKRTVYFDYAAGAPMLPKVFAAMEPYFTHHFHNPSALYAGAVLARNAVEDARVTVADVLHTQPDTIIFTSGGTESCNAAIWGVLGSVKDKDFIPHVITTTIEHSAVLEPLRVLEKKGVIRVTYLPVDSVGQVHLSEFKKALTKDTVLVSMMYANNEIGVIQPIGDIGRAILSLRKTQKTAYPFFHSDANQAASYLDLHVEALHVDLLSLNGAKIGGPRGVGALYCRRGVRLEPLLQGGGQEMGVRSGTEATPLIVGFAKALEIAEKIKEKEKKRVQALRDTLYKKLAKAVPDIFLNGPEVDSSDRLPNNLHLIIRGADAEAMILYLDAVGISVSSGSACTTDSDAVSHVLLACGKTVEEARQSIRLTLGHSTNTRDIDYAAKVFPGMVSMVREMTRHSL